MGKFLESEKLDQISFKQDSSYFSTGARAEGIYKGIARRFCLPREYAEENLFSGIRRGALDYFDAKRIRWHDGHDGRPSNHLCSSQVCCVNFLFPFADQPRALAEVLRPMFPSIERMLPIEDTRYVAFEWIGEKDYLGECRPGVKRTRGANCTSADAAVMFERSDGTVQIVLIEWKYTESYTGPLSKTNKDRTAIYKRVFDECPIDKTRFDYPSLFLEPFYQLMRQQLLAYGMELAREKGATAVTVLHIAPTCNTDFQRVTSSKLAVLGSTPTNIWKQVARPDGAFISVSTEKLFGTLSADRSPGMGAWLDYVHLRYRWLRAGASTAR